MSTIVTRAGKGSALTWNEADANFTNLNNDKLESSAIGTTIQAYDSNLTSFVNTFTLPTIDGTIGQTLITDGSGTLSFSSAGAGTVTSVSGTGTVNGITLTGTVTSSGNLTLGGTLSGIGNSQLTNSSITINGTPVSLGGSVSTGTVTSVSALTIGTTGTDLSSTVADGTTTPVITLNVPTASSSNRGALSSTDWSTFNSKQSALVSGTNIKTVNSNSLLGSGDISVGTVTSVGGGNGLTGSVSSSGDLALGTPSTLTTSTTNSVTADSHTHAVTFPVTSVNGSTGDVTVAAGGLTLLGTLTTTSGATQTLSGLTLTDYKYLYIQFYAVSPSTSAKLQFMGTEIVNLSIPASSGAFGFLLNDLISGAFTVIALEGTGLTTPPGTKSQTTIATNPYMMMGFSRVLNSSTSINFSFSAGNFDNGTIYVYGAK